MIRALVLGAAGGLVWGVAARGWMRLVSDDPEFTWSGTAVIVGLSVLAGASYGVVAGARRSGRRRWWRLAAVPALLMFASPGMLLLPSAVSGAVAVGVRHRATRVVAAVVAVASVSGTLVLLWPELPRQPVVAAVGLVVLEAALALGAAPVLARWPRDILPG